MSIPGSTPALDPTNTTESLDRGSCRRRPRRLSASRLDRGAVSLEPVHAGLTRIAAVVPGGGFVIAFTPLQAPVQDAHQPVGQLPQRGGMPPSYGRGARRSRRGRRVRRSARRTPAGEAGRPGAGCRTRGRPPRSSCPSGGIATPPSGAQQRSALPATGGGTVSARELARFGLRVVLTHRRLPDPNLPVATAHAAGDTRSRLAAALCWSEAGEAPLVCDARHSSAGNHAMPSAGCGTAGRTRPRPASRRAGRRPCSPRYRSA